MHSMDTSVRPGSDMSLDSESPLSAEHSDIVRALQVQLSSNASSRDV